MDFYSPPEFEHVLQLEHTKSQQPNSDTIYTPLSGENLVLLQKTCRQGFSSSEEIENILRYTNFYSFINASGSDPISFKNSGGRFAGDIITSLCMKLNFCNSHLKCRLMVAYQLKEYLAIHNLSINDNVFWQLIVKEYQCDASRIYFFNQELNKAKREKKELNNSSIRQWTAATNRYTECFGLNLAPTIFYDIFPDGKETSYLTDLFVTLHHNNEPVVVSGMGGIGKSALVTAYAKEAESSNAYDLIAWLNAENTGTLRDSYIALSNSFNTVYTEDDNIPLEKIINDVKIATTQNAKYSCLFILDHAPSYESVREFLPKRGKIIITTRAETVEVASLHLNPWNDTDALEYLSKQTRPKSPASPSLAQILDNQHIPFDQRKQLRDNVKELVTKLDGHPLALSLIPSHFQKVRAEEHLSYDAYFNQFENLLSRISNYVPVTSQSQTSLLACIYSSVINIAPVEKDLFFALCYMAPREIYKNFLNDFSGQSEVSELLTNLLDQNMCITGKFDGDDLNSVDMHRVYQDIGREIFERSTDKTDQEKSTFIEKIQYSLNEARIRYLNCLKEVQDTFQLKQINDELSLLSVHWKNLANLANNENIVFPDPDAFLYKEG
jgi:hypothetical protein